MGKANTAFMLDKTQHGTTQNGTDAVPRVLAFILQ